MNKITFAYALESYKEQVIKRLKAHLAMLLKDEDMQLESTGEQI